MQDYGGEGGVESVEEGEDQLDTSNNYFGRICRSEAKVRIEAAPERALVSGGATTE